MTANYSSPTTRDYRNHIISIRRVDRYMSIVLALAAGTLFGFWLALTLLWGGVL